MGTPHKHAAIIKAWADGAEIQERADHHGTFVNVKYPVWYNTYEYRIKPNPIRYRLCLMQGHGKWINAIQDDLTASRIQTHDSFVKWLGDWQEVEV